MTRASLSQEVTIMVLLIGFSVVVFAETAGLPPERAGRLSPGAFPRFAAGVIAGLAVLRLIRLLLAKGDLLTTEVWTLRSFGIPAAFSVLMATFFMLFNQVPFALLTAGFLAAAYLVIGVRPIGKLIVASVAGGGAMYLLFAQLLSIRL